MELILDALRRHAQQAPAAPAFVAGARVLDRAALCDRVLRLAQALAGGEALLALQLDGLDLVLADLAATLAGRRIVPLPRFFSPGQVSHVLAATGAQLVTALPEATGPRLEHARAGHERLIFTSGTTGTPKGVRLGAGQIAASVLGLAAAIRPEAADRYLSALPMAQLLEQICGIFLPVLAGAEVHLCPEGVAALFGGEGRAFARAALAADPTVTVLTPRQLALWVAELRAGTVAAPGRLRLVAVGGAPVAPALLAEARALGLPAVAGYGLSEACSVVALADPRAAPDGSVGRPIPGVRLRIEAGEIVVEGPTVMAGYLGRAPAGGSWRTGDLGRIEAGRLIVEGRRDALIRCPNGRKLAPEWVEAEALADPALAAAALVLAEETLVLLLAPAAAPDRQALARRLAALPAYARPARVVLADPRAPGLIRGAGTADRAVAAALIAEGRVADLALPAAECNDLQEGCSA